MAAVPKGLSPSPLPQARRREKGFHYGVRKRIGILDRLLQHMKSKGQVWFATHAEIAAWCKEHAGQAAPLLE